MGLYERIGRAVWIRQNPDWCVIRLRHNTWKLMHWYRVP